jgi:LysM repeat protein/ABC-type branched-subunit amino acid transport system substrate-binding protein
MPKFLYILLIVFVSLVVAKKAQSQEVTVKRSTVVENYKGKPFYIHFVSAGETLTGIAKAYKVTIEEITAENPLIDKGLKADMVIRIPFKQITESPEPDVKPQEIKPVQAKTSEDPDFILYTVKKQETLYGISKQYNITVEEILNANPGLDVLKDGMEIKIPKNKAVVKPVKAENSTIIKTGPVANPDEIIVKTGETLYSISKTYHVTVDELINLNPQLSGGLKAGMVLKLRQTSEKTVISTGTEKDTVRKLITVSDSTCYNDENLKKNYKIALLLPFGLEDSNIVLEAPVENDPSTYENFNYFQFYAGFMLAADSLSKYGLNASIRVLDADKLEDTLVIRQTLRKPGMDKMDLLVGPMYASSFTIAARFAEKNKIGIVNPLSRRETIVKGNPYVIKTQVSVDGITNKLSSFILSKYPGANIIAVQNDKKEMKSLASDFVTGIKKSIANQSFKGTISESVFSTEMMAGVTKKLKPGVKNIVIMFSNNKTAVPNFVSLLNPQSRSHDIILIGMDAWDELELETEFLVNLNFHQLTTNFIDYESEAVKQFITRFRNKYGAVPLSGRHAYLGYDIGWYFLTSLMWYGDDYINCMNGYKGKGLQYNFDFGAAGSDNGLENNSIDIIKLQDYKMIKVE